MTLFFENGGDCHSRNYSIDPYLQRVKAAGSFANYARNRLVTLTEMLTPRRGPSSPLRRVPPEVLRKIAAFAFHVGYY